MKKHKRIKALPVCSKTLREKCAIFQGCNSKDCTKKRTCAAFELIDHHFEENGKPDRITVVNCLCAEYQYRSHGCPYFRKAGE